MNVDGKISSLEKQLQALRAQKKTELKRKSTPVLDGEMSMPEWIVRGPKVSTGGATKIPCVKCGRECLVTMTQASKDEERCCDKCWTANKNILLHLSSKTGSQPNGSRKGPKKRKSATAKTTDTNPKKSSRVQRKPTPPIVKKTKYLVCDCCLFLTCLPVFINTILTHDDVCSCTSI